MKTLILLALFTLFMGGCSKQADYSRHTHTMDTLTHELDNETNR